jgi:hypothetical protein
VQALLHFGGIRVRTLTRCDSGYDFDFQPGNLYQIRACSFIKFNALMLLTVNKSKKLSSDRVLLQNSTFVEAKKDF